MNTNDQTPAELQETRLYMELRKLRGKARRESLRTAIELAIDELELHHVRFYVKIVPHIDSGRTWGDTLPLGNHKYRIRLATSSGDQFIRCAGHELMHVWQFENNEAIDCDAADRFGYGLVRETAYQLGMAQ